MFSRVFLQPAVLILNGPNLNMLGVREPHIYGKATLAEVRSMCCEKGRALGLRIDFRQTNHEGTLVTWIQRARGSYIGLILNAGAYTHTSIAIHDALKMVEMPVVEVHISDPSRREPFRHHSYVASLAEKSIVGQGVDGYMQALEHLGRAVHDAS